MEVPLDALVHRTTQVTYQRLSQLVDSLQNKRCAAAQHPYAPPPFPKYCLALARFDLSLVGGWKKRFRPYLCGCLAERALSDGRHGQCACCSLEITNWATSMGVMLSNLCTPS